ncbi:tRNA epoxyqueuosine(34) reductase QueG [Sulfitobacter mediterraneus]|uniref:tRNA epoxyqueuosine(34) reductase QueG n=1 Tax=Sulfitobacter mediterraneus TaxID=83219 RepID=UPI0019332997|nr:tRNA epoxyqueuosine(34) reductase QueG [Sulfitobacter mediterraneus]MBM1633054.1 tRNA epoxyqueuosine(34) reductase QueG [Sulfitobacter mediterraneus]MBM1640812.1 tRNA epoxyqueuosine(34) reductase QueG [Sulfitobacter mediterraneus]MBM1644919.1 tRNA epoxyqueuosine(34) reductase QueG [Sulfitobacter mediterraneus]MBM1648932.1 tRNA epoxyqueuosine(34) reductase QueG [Sulfitobacter mediterraneus]MBM1652953.1 tRNA epoxyqueuosine(34) reductase QueG [Sulfitobacter mediterraneus]
MDLKARLVDQALTEGFVSCRLCKPWDVPEMPDRLAAFVAAGYHGQMGWMEERMHWRGNPAALWPEAKTVIMLAESYAPEQDPLAVLEHPEKAAISVYAQGRDYHDVVKKRLKRLARWLIEQEPCEVKVFVDTAPVPEKALAQASGLGWQGKHTNVLSREWGNWGFLGSVFTTLDLPADAPEIDHCGSCRACQDICPTDAFVAPYQLDPRRCISYLTIEHDGPVDLELREKMGNRIYGCDDCLAICPWNKFAPPVSDDRYHGAHVEAADLADLASLDDAAFRLRFSGSPIKRIGRNRFVRNVLYAIGNSGVPALHPAASALRDDADPTVAEAARWAMARLTAG